MISWDKSQRALMCQDQAFAWHRRLCSVPEGREGQPSPPCLSKAPHLGSLSVSKTRSLRHSFRRYVALFLQISIYDRCQRSINCLHDVAHESSIVDSPISYDCGFVINDLTTFHRPLHDRLYKAPSLPRFTESAQHRQA